MATKVAVIGAGTWGTALAKLLAEKGVDVTLWAYEPEVAESINKEHRNALFLSDIALPPALKSTNDLNEALTDKEVAVSVVPTQVLRKVWEMAAASLSTDTILVSCSKGIEEGTKKLVSQILSESLPNHAEDRRVFLSGPSFAKEVAHNLPTTVTIAGKNSDYTKKIQDLFRTETFLTYTHDDIIGVEVGGAVKNVLAIATGTSDGLGFGRNTRAALITRGLYEMTKIGLALGAQSHTFMGLAGIGDLVLTATDELSRNYTVGHRLGSGEAIGDIIGGMTMVAEGYKTSIAVKELTDEFNIDAPICNTVYEMLHADLSPQDGAYRLCHRPLAEELRGIER
jgi:glycerol-3-phosphate dehydrogenase (NAD(P)+)